MSYTEFHTGELVPVKTLSAEEFIKFQEENLSSVIFEDLFENIEDGREYFEGYDKVNRKLVYIYHKNTLYEVKNHKQEDDTDYLLDVSKTEGGKIKFNLIFYNGGTCFSEMLEEGLDDL